MPLVIRFFLFASPLVLAVILIGTWASFTYFESYVEDRIRHETVNFARVQATRVQAALNRDKELLRSLDADDTLAELSARHRNDSSAALRAQAAQLLATTTSQRPRIQGAILFDLDGSVVARSRGFGILTPENLAVLHQRTLAGTQSPQVVNDGDTQHLLLSKVVQLSGTAVGSIHAIFGTEEYVAIAQIDTELSRSLESVIAAPDIDGRMHSIGPLRFDPAARRYVVLAESEYPVLGNRGAWPARPFQRSTPDYRGKHVTTAVTKVPNSDWLLHVKLDRAEAFARLDARRNLAWLAIAAVAAATMLVIWAAGRTVTRPLGELTRDVLKLGHLNAAEIKRSYRRNEIEHLRAAFNETKQHIQGEQSRLKQALATKTAEFEAANDKLRQINIKTLDANNALRRAQEALQENESRLELAIQASIGGYWEWQLENRDFIWLSDSCKAILCLDFEGNLVAISDALAVFSESQAAKLSEQDFAQFTKTGLMDTELKLETRARGTRWIAFHAAAEPQRNEAGLPYRAAGTVTDITARKLAEQEVRNLLDELSEKATTDPLTGLSNRHHLNEILVAELARVERHPDHPLSVIAIDVDHFKAVNDTHGHLTGDDILAGIGACLFAACRPPDEPCRFGGEEFLVLLPETGAEGAAAFGERVRQSIAALQIRNRDGEVVPVTASLGVAQWRPGETAEDLLNRADKMLYKAKQKGRNRIELAAAVG